ncbi:MAG: hypothetical protein ACE5R6_15630 [Candidatus Heimdallarchaeota archaeon]
MVSSVAIDDDLRRKLKLLAAKYDTTQAEIIKRAIELFEARKSIPEHHISSRVREELERASVIVFRTNPRRKRIAEALNKPGIDIDELRIAFNA